MHRLFQWIFRSPTVRPATAEDLQAVVAPVLQRCAQLEQRLAALEDDHVRLDLAFNSFRGRVYAWRKWEPEPKPAAGAPEESIQLPNTDPRVTKAELRSRLLKPGKPFNHN